MVLDNAIKMQTLGRIKREKYWFNFPCMARIYNYGKEIRTDCSFQLLFPSLYISHKWRTHAFKGSSLLGEIMDKQQAAHLQFCFNHMILVYGNNIQNNFYENHTQKRAILPLFGSFLFVFHSSAISVGLDFFSRFPSFCHLSVAR